MSIPTVSSYTDAVEQFLEAATWLTAADLPGVMTLKTLAGHLDNVEAGKLPQAALVSQFNMAFRDLRGREPKTGTGAADPLAAAMAAASQPDLFEAAAEAYHAGKAGAA